LRRRALPSLQRLCGDRPREGEINCVDAPAPTAPIITKSLISSRHTQAVQSIYPEPFHQRRAGPIRHRTLRYSTSEVCDGFIQEFNSLAALPALHKVQIRVIAAALAAPVVLASSSISIPALLRVIQSRIATSPTMAVRAERAGIVIRAGGGTGSVKRVYPFGSIGNIPSASPGRIAKATGWRLTPLGPIAWWPQRGTASRLSRPPAHCGSYCFLSRPFVAWNFGSVINRMAPQTSGRRARPLGSATRSIAATSPGVSNPVCRVVCQSFKNNRMLRT